MAARWHVITPAARDALETDAACDGPCVTITRQLGPTVWRQVKLVLDALGAVYVIGSSAFEFAADRSAETVLRDALDAGKVMHDKGLVGFVPTPTDLAEHVVRWHAEFPSRRRGVARVLEPSAGTGRLVDAVVEFVGRKWVHVTAVEADPRRARQIQAGDHVSVHDVRFEDYATRAIAAGERFDTIVMNPPFSVPGKPTLWVDHLLLAWELLAPGGRLVAIVPGAVLGPPRHSRRVREARELVRLNGAAVPLDDDEFAESGITVATAIAWLDRPPVETPSPALPPTRHRALFRLYQGDEVGVLVERPYLTHAAARSMPVQVWHDSWRGERRTLRYRAECAECAQPLWTFDDGENDPRGVLGNSSGGFFINALDEKDVFGTPVGLCPLCATTYESYTRGMALARRLWAEEAAAPRCDVSASHPTPAPEEPAQAALVLFDADALGVLPPTPALTPTLHSAP
jgi:SAM-dependent methyltransferase